ncbi:MAG: LarC family nickel insertion protein [Gemmatimonadetes bacterium]|nr:LarC family nickel insertion protein [Gemmatimonadota bacterium]MYD27214.1 LarC family nickel insertion protein [Gemmatimonadota bacterium]MYI98732.1 LarC family nickel insertion protein [Gemmatimonadota bacterium]
MAVAGYFDQLSGFTADMLLGALIDAGSDREEIAAALKRHHGVDCEINVTKERVEGTQVTYASLSCVKASVPESFRTIPDGRADTPAGALLARVIDHLEQNASELWGAQDHAQDHAPSVEALGGRHTALRILILCNALHLLEINALYHEALPFAAGIDATPPLLAALMRGATVRPVDRAPVDRAPVDLAGYAVLTALSAGSMHGFEFTLRSVGCGGNDADRGDGNLVRLCLGEVAHTGGITQVGDCESVQVLETQIDDMNPQFYGHVLDLLLDAGALDAFLTPVIMKKSRPGVLLTVLAPTALAGQLTELIFKETTTIGLRSYPVTRSVLPRREARTETPFGAIRIKVVRQGNATRYTPEYEDCRQAALKAGIPLAEVYAAVHEAAGRMDLDDLP